LFELILQMFTQSVVVSSFLKGYYKDRFPLGDMVGEIRCRVN